MSSILKSVEFIRINFFIWIGQETFFSCLLICLPPIMLRNLGHHFASTEFIQVRGLLPGSIELLWSTCSFIFTSKWAFPHAAERPPGICPLCFAVTRHSSRVRGSGTEARRTLQGLAQANHSSWVVLRNGWWVTWRTLLFNAKCRPPYFSSLLGKQTHSSCSVLWILSALGAREEGGWEPFPARRAGVNTHTNSGHCRQGTTGI